MSPGTHRGLIVDFGGVLTTSVFESFRAFCEQEALDPETVGRLFRKDPRARELLVGLEEGRLGDAEFEQGMAGVLGLDDHADLIVRMLGGSREETAMVGAVRRARAAGVRTGLLSNSWGVQRYDRDRLRELFDGVVISGEVGIRKPEPRIYDLAVDAVGVPAELCVYVDDLPFNLEPAAALGMATIHHTDAERTIDALEELLGATLR